MPPFEITRAKTRDNLFSSGGFLAPAPQGYLAPIGSSNFLSPSPAGFMPMVGALMNRRNEGNRTIDFDNLNKVKELQVAPESGNNSESAFMDMMSKVLLQSGESKNFTPDETQQLIGNNGQRPYVPSANGIK